MSVNNPNFSVGQGDRRVDEAQKQELLGRIQKAHIGSTAASPLSLNMSHAVSTYQVTKTLTRQIAPVPGNTVLGGIAKHSITSLNPAIHKKEIQKAPLSLTSTAAITTIAGTGIIPVQISGPSTTTATSSTLHVPNVSSIVRGSVPTLHHPTQFSHLPRGVVASAQVRSGSAVNIQRQTLPTSMQATALSLQGQIRNVIPHMIRPGTPPTNRSASPAISIGSAQTSDAHRASISLHNVTTVGNTPSIQITLQASRTQADLAGKPVGSLQPAKISNQALNMSSQPKVVMTPPLTQVLQHPTLAAKGNRGQPVGTAPLSTVTVALSTTTVTIPIISSGPTSTTIPIAKVPPQRQHITQQPPQSHAVPTTIAVSSLAEHRSESSSFPQPQPAHAHTAPATQSHTAQVHSTQSQLPAHSQAASSLFMYRSSPIVTTSNTPHTESRESSIPTMPFFPPYMLSPDNPYYQQLMRCQVAAVAQAQARPGLLPSQTTANLAASLQAVSQGVSQAATGTNVRFNHPLMVMQDSLRQATPHTAAQTAAAGTQIHPIATDGASKVSTALSNSMVTMAAEKTPHQAGMSVSAVAAVASSLFTAATQNLHVPQIGQPAPNAASNTPVSNPNASPRPSILRKRTNEGVSAVKKQLAMTTEVHSPRPEARPDSTPQSNMSSPKTPASGESQSSTDTALSSEATTPTQPHDKVKQEIHDPHENGYANNTPEASPRKRRKQLLQATEEIKDTPVSVFDKLVEACVKEDLECNNYNMEDEEEDLFDEDDDDLLSDDNRGEIRDEYVDEEGIRWTLEKCRPGVALLNYYNISWKPRNNHFNRYTDVKAKDERRPTVNELSNQKGVIQKASGWKLYHMAAQIEDLFELEKELNNQLTSLQAAIGPEPPLKTSLLEDESGMIHELTQGNIQRCKLISDQLNDAKAQMLKVLDHKPKISEIITKHISKRPIKKKERT
ncbi:histone deacetylase complex subunit SAP130-like isoform X2 [Mercenaria mercenaria]|uniref:histone deacetylase complex subunit SAP130-like isoform X2 n=1 Tax=Mercenaria mercenaria TaxID=6596 RepID=UPI00234E7E93|nr:histone deacetylase complex subunit SAP130-like isoform X2 [Mercenaria mercenaria]